MDQTYTERLARITVQNTTPEVEANLRFALAGYDSKQLDVLCSDLDRIIQRIRETKKALIYLKNVGESKAL